VFAPLRASHGQARVLDLGAAFPAAPLRVILEEFNFAPAGGAGDIEYVSRPPVPGILAGAHGFHLAASVP